MNCSTRKAQYESRGEATAFARRSTVGAGAKGKKPYRCSECGLWHLGGKVPKHVQRSVRRYMEGRFEDERGLDAS